MSSEYDKLLSMVNKLNKVQGEKCLICHFPDSEENLIKLNCNHFFHAKCLDNSLMNSIICPYCGTKTKKISQKEALCKVILTRGANKGKECGRTNCKYHKNIPIIINQIKKPDKLVCNTVIKSGPRKGELCSRINCGYHKIKNIVV